MGLQSDNFMCPSDEIASYIDGELTPKREIELDAHFAACPVCAEELNQQKQFLCQLDFSLKRNDELDLPADFTKTIVANAESTVSGLRRPREQFNAIFICAGLLLFVLFALGADAGLIFKGIAVVFEQIVAVGSFFGHLVYAIFIGLSIILRSLVSQVRVDLVIGVVFAAVSAAALVFISRRLMRMRRSLIVKKGKSEKGKKGKREKVKKYYQLTTELFHFSPFHFFTFSPSDFYRQHFPHGLAEVLLFICPLYSYSASPSLPIPK